MAGLDHFEKLVGGLVQKTRSGDIKWESKDGSTLFLSTANGSVVLSSRDDDGQSPYRIAIFDKDGRQVDTFALSEFSTDREEDVLDDRLTELYGIARRSALKIDQVVRGIMDDLGI